LTAHPQMDDHGLSGIQLKEKILGSSLQGYDLAAGNFPDKTPPGRIMPENSNPFRIEGNNNPADYFPPETVQEPSLYSLDFRQFRHFTS